jgi:hypothetical protein
LQPLLSFFEEPEVKKIVMIQIIYITPNLETVTRNQ